jgi:hypothetical protein
MARIVKKRGRRPILTPSIKAFIKAKVLQENSKPEAERISRTMLANIILEGLKGLCDDKGRRLLRTLPLLSTVEKEISKCDKNDSELDKPWCVTAISISKYDIPSEALPAILQIWSKIYELSIRERRPELITERMTIRIARWIGRLYHVVREGLPLGWEDIPQDKRADPDLWLPDLYFEAVLYARYERIMELIGKYPDTYYDIQAYWLHDAELAGSDWLSNRIKKDILKLGADQKLLDTIVRSLGEGLEFASTALKSWEIHKKTKKEANDESSNLLSGKHRRPGKRGNVTTDTA